MSNALYIIWNDSNMIGIPIIDEQHRGIISTINSLHYFIQIGHGEEVLRPTLNMLSQYTEIHFKTEAALMKKANYPQLDEHLGFHRSLATKTKELATSIGGNNDPADVLKFLKDWWLSHINGEDKKYVPFIKI